MKTSNEIKEFIIKCIRGKNIFALYFEIFDELEETSNAREMKAVNYRWASACDEIRKESGSNAIDNTFCRSIICYNTVLNFRHMNADSRIKRIWKEATGWDAEAITNGKHCELAQMIIDALESKETTNNKI